MLVQRVLSPVTRRESWTRPERQRPLLMAISGHKRLATLQQYVQPSPAAIAALMASSDPDRRNR